MNNFDPTAGKNLNAMRIGDYQFTVSTRFEQLKVITHDPQSLQANAKRPAGDYDLEAYADLQNQVQRALAGNKKSNVAPFAKYIAELSTQGQHSAPMNILPTIHLWSEKELEFGVFGAGTFVQIPDGARLIAIDGETQLTAHYKLHNDPAVSSEVKAAHAKLPLSVTIHHNIPIEVARQYFHDLNMLGVRLNTSLGLSMDAKDPLTKIVNTLAVYIPFLTGRVDRSARQLSKRSRNVITLQALRQAVVNVAIGIGGNQYGSKPAPLGDVDLGELEAVCKGWLSAYFDTFARQVEDRENCLAGTGTTLAAVGAMGHKILAAPADQRAYVQATLLDQLRTVDWTKGDQWSGIAGSITPRGAFTVKGTKEAGNTVFHALTDAESHGFKRIRNQG